MLLKLVRAAFNRGRPRGDTHARALDHYQHGELEKAEQYFREVVRQEPANVTAWTDLAVTLMSLQKHAEAIPILLHAIELKPELAEAHLDLGVCYNRLKDNREAIASYQRALALKSNLHLAHANIVTAYLDACDWKAVDRWRTGFMRYRSKHPARAWTERVDPATALMLFPGQISREVAIYRAKKIAQAAAGKGERGAAGPGNYSHKRIRIGYVSADFHNHPTAHLTFGLFEAHDRSAFEIFAYSCGPDDGSDYRKHLESTCEHFIDVRSELPERTAERIRADEIDILVDMKGHTVNSRLEIFAGKPAPVQVAYLGYPGTSGAPFIDYFISDRVATPPGFDKEFTEKIVYLPGSYQVNDSRQPIANETRTRADYGLPEDAFVYCSFNRLGKIDRTIFSAWMEILRAVPNSVLWLIREDPLAETNLRDEATSRQVDPQRLIFSDKIDKPEHLARHRLADLFLDTYTVNAHTGASDALRAGLPLLTCPGASFIARVAASLLDAVGLPELAVANLEEYKKLAVHLAQDTNAIADLRDKLDRQRLTYPLFDTRRFVRNLEVAYGRMHEISRSGRAPESFSVPDRAATPAESATAR